jgi:hypothetical protein
MGKGVSIAIENVNEVCAYLCVRVNACVCVCVCVCVYLHFFSCDFFIVTQLSRRFEL